MNILIVADSFFPSQPGGLARVAWDAAKALARRGHSVDLVAADFKSDAASLRESYIEGVTCHLFSRPRFPYWDPRRFTAALAAYSAPVTRVLAAKHFDVIHFHTIFTGHAVLRALRRVSQQAALVYTIHSPVAPEQILTWSQQGIVGLVNQGLGLPIVRGMERTLLARADAAHVLSQFTAGELAKEHPGLRISYHVVPHFFYEAWRRSMPRSEAKSVLGWAADRPALFTVRQLRYRYGIEDAIVAAAPLASAGRCTFHIAGDGPDRGKLERLIDQAGCQDDIKIMGSVPDDTLHLAYQAADLFLLPTRALECFGLISLEAMIHGLPVLATSVGAIPEVVGPVLPGFLTMPGDPVALRAKLADYLDGRLVPPSEQVLCRYVSDNYCEAAVMERYERMYEAARLKRDDRNSAGGRWR